jgi:hypothetical protein
MDDLVQVQGDLGEEPGMDGLRLSDLSADDRQRMDEAKVLFDQAETSGSVAAWQQAGDATLAAYQERDDSMPVGFQKLLIAQLSECGAHLWEDLQDGPAAYPLLDFAHDEIKARGWAASGNQTPLGRQRSYLVATRFEVSEALEAQRQPKRRGLFGRRG